MTRYTRSKAVSQTRAWYEDKGYWPTCSWCSGPHVMDECDGSGPHVERGPDAGRTSRHSSWIFDTLLCNGRPLPAPESRYCEEGSGLVSFPPLFVDPKSSEHSAVSNIQNHGTLSVDEDVTAIVKKIRMECWLEVPFSTSGRHFTLSAPLDEQQRLYGLVGSGFQPLFFCAERVQPIIGPPSIEYKGLGIQVDYNIEPIVIPARQGFMLLPRCAQRTYDALAVADMRPSTGVIRFWLLVELVCKI